jgi:hypothetical protein
MFVEMILLADGDGSLAIAERCVLDEADLALVAVVRQRVDLGQRQVTHESAILPEILGNDDMKVTEIVAVVTLPLIFGSVAIPFKKL